MRNESEKLLGDYTAEKMKALRLDRVAKRLSAVVGVPCKCAKNQEALNNMHRKFKKKDST